MADYLKIRGTGKRVPVEWIYTEHMQPVSVKTTDGRIWFYHTTKNAKDVYRYDSSEGVILAVLERKNMPRTSERGRDYGVTRHTMKGKKFSTGDRIRFKSDRSLGTVIRSTPYTLTVKFDDGEIGQVSPHEVIHSSVVKVGRLPNAGAGVRATFHGMFKTKREAVAKERTVPGSFIREKDGYYFVLKPKPGTKNPGGRVKIYGRCLRIEAIKTVKHTYGGKSTGAGQRYFHDFTTKNAKIYGLPNGDLLISAR